MSKQKTIDVTNIEKSVTSLAENTTFSDPQLISGLTSDHSAFAVNQATATISARVDKLGACIVNVVNFFAVAKISRHYLTQMVARKSGIIINMCSIASFLAGGGGSAHTASKHALAGFTRQLALDYADQGIQVFGIAPGAVKTAMTTSDFEPGGLADWVANQTPIKRWLVPEEIAALTVYLTSGKAQAMQGQIIQMDGGWGLK